MQIQLKRLRKLAGYKTQADFAAALGVPERRYASWERKEAMMSLEQAFQITEMLHCTLDELVGRTVTPGFSDKRQAQINDDFEIMSEPLKDAAASSIHGMMLSESARALEERPETDTRCQAS